MNIFSSIGHFLEHLFGANSNVAETILGDVSHIVTLAGPIVADVEADLKTIPQGSTVAAIEKFLAKYAPDASKVGALAGQLAELSGPDLWRNAAQMALSFLAPAGTAASLLNLAIEFAYQIFQKKQAAAAPAPVAAAPAPAPVPAS